MPTQEQQQLLGKIESLKREINEVNTRRIVRSELEHINYPVFFHSSFLQFNHTRIKRMFLGTDKDGTPTLEFYNANKVLVLQLQGATDFSENQISLAGALFGAATQDANYDAGYKIWAGGFGGTGIATFIEARNNETATDVGTISIRTDGQFWHYGSGSLPVFKLSSDGSMKIKDGVTAPGTESGFASIYVDTADGDLKVKFGNGFVATIATDS